MVMDYSSLSEGFSDDKSRFFPTMRSPGDKRPNEFTLSKPDKKGVIEPILSQDVIESICTLRSEDAILRLDRLVCEEFSYSFLLENLQILEAEFTHLFTVLQRSSQDKERFWFYCYYCASQLEAFHLAYGQMGKAELYQQKKRAIKARLGINNGSVADHNTVEKDFIETLKDSLLDGISSLIKAPFHVAQIRDHVAYTNICRIYWVFCRLTVTQGLTIAKNLQLIDKLDVILGTHTDVDKIIATMRAPTGVINYFSVGFFLARFMIDGAMLIKHTFFPSELEKQGTTTYQRFKHELYKRHCNFANDLVWATVNFLSNFNHLVGISASAAGYLTSVFLVFDIGMTFYKLHLAEQEYLIKKRQYSEEAEVYKEKLREGESLSPDEEAHYTMLIKQRLELDINWKAKEAMFHFVAAAAALLMMGFTASLLLSPPGLVLAAYFTCTIGVAMYLSYGSYFNYKEKEGYLNQAVAQDTQEKQKGHELTRKYPRTIPLFASGSNYLALARKEYETARNDFIFTMAKNIIVPAVLISTYAIFWPAAVALTALYLGYELLHAFNQHQDKKEIKRLASEASVNTSPSAPSVA